MKYRLAIFDFDGTLADSFSWFASAIGRIAPEFGLRSPSNADLEALRGQPIKEVIRHLGVPMWKMPKIAAKMRSLMAGDLHTLSLFPGIAQGLAQLSDRGVRLAIVSSNSEENVRAVLGPLAQSIANYECGVSLFGKASRLKKALRRFDLPPSSAVYVGDELRDLDAARAAGMDFGAVAWGYTRADALQAAAPSLFFETPDDILEAVAPSGPLAGSARG